MMRILELAEQHGYLLVFTAVVVEQFGVPLPAFPVLIVAGALIAKGVLAAPAVLVLAVTAALASDLVWFQFGRTFGSRVLGWMCRLSLSPDKCVSDTERAFGRFGLKALLVTRFIPGLGAIAPALAGLSGYLRRHFALFDGLGATLWAGTALAVGAVFHREVERVLVALGHAGPGALVLLAVLVVPFVGWKIWQRYRFGANTDVPRITADELRQMLESPNPPHVLDVRSAPVRSAEPASIPSAIGVDLERFDDLVATLSRERPIIVVCACPGEAGAAKLALVLRSRGFARAYPLAGGFSGWASSGSRAANAGTTPNLASPVGGS
jgi:membrane protein DedA with SNARE-associated domain/rhodanese-related sulfurtransferase